MPQIAQLAETYSSQIFWLLIFFGITFFFVGRGMVPKAMATVQDRNDKIAGDLAAAKAARDAADEEEETWRKRENENRANAQAIVAEAKAEAAATNERKLAEAQKRLDAQVNEAEARIAEAREAAMSEIEAVAVAATQDIVQRLAGINVPAAAAKSSVEKALQHG